MLLGIDPTPATLSVYLRKQIVRYRLERWKVGSRPHILVRGASCAPEAYRDGGATVLSVIVGSIRDVVLDQTGARAANSAARRLPT